MSKEFKETVKMVVSHFFVITVSVIFFISIANLIVRGNTDYYIKADFPWIMLLTGALGALPSLLFYFRKEPTKSQFIIRVVFHFITIAALIMTEGFFVGWYTDIINALEVFAVFLAVYILVWVITYFGNKATADNINNALKSFNSDEEE